MAEAVLSDSDRAEAVWNVKADAFFGRGEREGHGQEPVLTGRLDEELFWRACERAAAGERIERFRVECVKPDGARVEAALWITPPAESAPVNQGPFVQVPDVRGEIQDESRSPVSNKELEFILGHVPLAILFIEPRSQTIIDSSSSVTALFGYLPGQLAGQSVKILFRGTRDYAAGKAAVRAALEAQVVTRGTHHMRDKSGRGFNGKVTVVPGTEFGEAAGRVMLIVQEIPGQ
ncbi:MAG: PAS domain-containing protein [Candidatus Hydrogenedentes bacterium]|nr:PAS domain-containing protein [Candidatus Hydrogenedentota bacterium]